MAGKSEKLKVILWGLGKNLEKNILAIGSRIQKGEIEIIAVTDKNKDCITYNSQYRFVAIDELSIITKDIDYVLVTTTKYYEEVKEQAINQGFEAERIIPANALAVLNKTSISQIAIFLKRHLSILSNNCWGGITYHSLCMGFYSPLINMAVKNDDEYLKLVSNLKFYMVQPVEYVGVGHNQAKGFDYPIGKIGDVTLDFIHYQNFEEAVKCWERRKRRINYDDLFIMMYSENYETAMRFQEVPIKNKVIFVPNEYNLEYAYWLKNDKQYKNFWEVVIDAASGHNAQYDLSQFIK